MTMTISGSGTITGLSAGGLPDASITQAELATGVAGTGPAFSAYQSSAQTLSTGTWTKIQLQTEEFDTNSNFNNTGSTVGSTPAYAFLPTVAGYYLITGGFTIATVSASLLTQVYKNGSSFKRTSYLSGSQVGTWGSTLVYLNGTTDYVELYGYTSATNTLSASLADTYFQAVLVRSA